VESTLLIHAPLLETFNNYYWWDTIALKRPIKSKELMEVLGEKMVISD